MKKSYLCSCRLWGIRGRCLGNSASTLDRWPNVGTFHESTNLPQVCSGFPEQRTQVERSCSEMLLTKSTSARNSRGSVIIAVRSASSWTTDHVAIAAFNFYHGDKICHEQMITTCQKMTRHPNIPGNTRSLEIAAWLINRRVTTHFKASDTEAAEKPLISHRHQKLETMQGGAPAMGVWPWTITALRSRRIDVRFVWLSALCSISRWRFWCRLSNTCLIVFPQRKALSIQIHVI